MNDRLLRMVREFDQDQPLASAETIPNNWYFDQDLAALESRVVFGDTWQCVGRTTQIEHPGSYLTSEIADEPILAVRDDQGTLRAFHNVCRHRAARVAIEPEGAASRFRCRYHGWTYDLAGGLRGCPEFDGVERFCRDDHGLVPMAIDSWGPLVFVHWGKTPSPLASFLNPLPEHVSHFGLERMRFSERREYVLSCNWKVFVDNYLDGGYHVNTIHEGLAGVLDYAEYHTELFGYTSLQSSPLRAPDHDREDASAASVRTGERAYYWWVFPNLMLNIYAGVMDTNIVLPQGPGRCRVIFDFYFDSSFSEDQIAESILVADRIQQEDIAICEDVQRGLASSSYRTGRYSVRREAGVHHFHSLLARTLRAG